MLGVMRKKGVEPQEIFLKITPLTSAMHATNALFYTRSVVEQHKKVAILDSKKCLWLEGSSCSIVLKESSILELNAHDFKK